MSYPGFPLKPSLSVLNLLGGLWRQHPRYVGCVGHWLMVEEGGLTLYDLTGSGRHMLLTNGPTWSMGLEGPVLVFDDAALQSAELAVPLVTAAPLSLVAWAMPDVIGREHAVASIADSAGTVQWYMLNIGTLDRPEAALRGGGSINAAVGVPGSITANTWYHLAGVYGSTTSQQVYLNGVLAGTSASSNTPTGLDRTALGRLPHSTGVDYFSGMISEVRIYNRALSAADIQWLYTQPSFEVAWAWDLLYGGWTFEAAGAALAFPPLFRRRMVSVGV